jgi:hypothetical protein
LYDAKKSVSALLFDRLERIAATLRTRSVAGTGAIRLGESVEVVSPTKLVTG